MCYLKTEETREELVTLPTVHQILYEVIDVQHFHLTIPTVRGGDNTKRLRFKNFSP